jgi:hypothetical protein
MPRRRAPRHRREHSQPHRALLRLLSRPVDRRLIGTAGMILGFFGCLRVRISRPPLFFDIGSKFQEWIPCCSEPRCSIETSTLRSSSVLDRCRRRARPPSRAFRDPRRRRPSKNSTRKQSGLCGMFPVGGLHRLIGRRPFQFGSCASFCGRIVHSHRVGVGPSTGTVPAGDLPQLVGIRVMHRSAAAAGASNVDCAGVAPQPTHTTVVSAPADSWLVTERPDRGPSWPSASPPQRILGPAECSSVGEPPLRSRSRWIR